MKTIISEERFVDIMIKRAEIYDSVIRDIEIDRKEVERFKTYISGRINTATAFAEAVERDIKQYGFDGDKEFLINSWSDVILMDKVALKLLEKATPGSIFAFQEIYEDANKIIQGVMYALDKREEEKENKRLKRLRIVWEDNHNGEACPF